MKNLIALILLCFVQVAAASSYGKFKLVVNPDIYSGEEVVFLLNSAGEVSILENDSYYDINVSSFFGELTFDIQSGGDEDFIKASFKMVNNKLVAGCSAFVDLKNEVLSVYSSSQVDILRWSKSEKEYVSIQSDNIDDASEGCIKDLISNYPDFETF